MQTVRVEDSDSAVSKISRKGQVRGIRQLGRTEIQSFAEAAREVDALEIDD